MGPARCRSYPGHLPVFTGRVIALGFQPRNVMEITFDIAVGSHRPIYRQIVDQARRRVLSGAWLTGEEVPSVREVARALTINPMTVSKAYQQLESEGLFVRRRGLPMVIGSPSAALRAMASSDADPLGLLRPELQHAAIVVDELGVPHTKAVRLFGDVLRDRRQ